ncbi:6698_t:CDS:2, partial [Dentiscutata heterogama]
TTHRPLVYIGNAVRTKRRRRQLQREAAVGTPKLELFWSPMVNRHMNMDDDGMSNTISSDSDSETFGSDFEVETVEDRNIMSLENLNHAIKQLEKEIKSDKYSEVVKARLYTMLSYFCLVERGQKRIEASIIVAEAAGKGVYHAHCIRAWAVNYIKNGEFPISRQENHPKTWSFLWDDDVLIQIKSFLRSNKWN